MSREEGASHQRILRTVAGLCAPSFLVVAAESLRRLRPGSLDGDVLLFLAAIVQLPALCALVLTMLASFLSRVPPSTKLVMWGLVGMTFVANVYLAGRFHF